MTERRVPAGTSNGGRFAPSPRPEALLRLPITSQAAGHDVELAVDESEEASRALTARGEALARPRPDDARPWASAQVALRNNAAALAQVTHLRDFLARQGAEANRSFASRRFNASEFAALSVALREHRAHMAAAARDGSGPARTALRATDAALFRLDIATPLPESQESHRPDAAERDRAAPRTPGA